MASQLQVLITIRIIIIFILAYYKYFNNLSRTIGKFELNLLGVLGDQQAALFGQTCFDVGDSKCTYGTGAFILMNTGTSLRTSSFGLLSTVAYQTKDGQAVYALEGSVAYSGSVIQWLRDNLKIISNAGETEGMARTVEDGSGGVVSEIIHIPL